MDSINKYLAESDKSNENLVIKVAMVLGIYGALRISEITYLNFEDIRQDGINYVVIIRQSKTDQAGTDHEFYISPSPRADICPCTILSSYIDLFIEKSGRFFRKIGANGKPTNQAIGVNTISKYPEHVAKFLGLDGNFTGHCFRRSSATIIADNGANHLQLKRLGRWKSNSVAEGYLDNSKTAKLEVSTMISGNGTTKNGQIDGGFVNCSFNNCNITMYK